MSGFYDFSVQSIDGEPRALGDYEGKVVLVVNVASECGYTPHYTGLQKLQERYVERGFAVLGFPCNQFGAQEPGTDAQVKEFCSTRYGVTFPLFSKIDVNGEKRNPLYAWLTGVEIGPVGAGDIDWNFEKFVIDRKGNPIGRFAPETEPEAKEVVELIERALG